MRRNGNPAENCVAEVLREAGYLHGSRRHETGPGDHLAIHPTQRPLLVETKGGQFPFENFRRHDREAMIETAVRYDATPLLAWVLNVKRKEIMWFPVEDWPA